MTPPHSLKRPLVISWVIDGTIALALLGAIWQGGQFVERLEGVIDGLESLGHRVTALESQPIGPESSRRLSLLETRADYQDRALSEQKRDLTSRLDRIEDKLDRALAE